MLSCLGVISFHWHMVDHSPVKCSVSGKRTWIYQIWQDFMWSHKQVRKTNFFVSHFASCSTNNLSVVITALSCSLGCYLVNFLSNLNSELLKPNWLVCWHMVHVFVNWSFVFVWCIQQWWYVS